MSKMYINGAFVSSPERFEVKNPTTGEVLNSMPIASPAQVEEAIAAAKASQKAWEARPAIERASYLRKIAANIRANADEIAKVIVKEQGKILGLAQVEVAFTADYMDYMSEWARRYEGEILQSDRAREKIFLFKQAIGVTTGILPWNFPFFLIARKLAPAFVTGNTIVIKPSSDTPNNAYEFAKALHEAGLPKGVFNLVYGSGSSVGSTLASHKDVGMVSFTGSVEAGVKIMEAASKNLVKVNLELGGKAPAIVCDDANIDAAVNFIKASRVINSGQVCNCAERVYVQEGVYEAFLGKLIAAMKGTSFGDPFGNVDMGPMINRAGWQSAADMLARAANAGAKIECGGKNLEQNGGLYFEPTVVTGLKQSDELIQKEVFAPILPVIAFKELDEAIELANDSDYGLTSSIYTQNLSRAMQACKELKFGETYVNRENFEAMQGFHAGFRKSGIGGADGKHGLEEYLASHIVYLDY